MNGGGHYDSDGNWVADDAVPAHEAGVANTVDSLTQEIGGFAGAPHAGQMAEAMLAFQDKAGLPSDYDWTPALTGMWQRQASTFNGWSNFDDWGQNTQKLLQWNDFGGANDARDSFVTQLEQSPAYRQGQQQANADWQKSNNDSGGGFGAYLGPIGGAIGGYFGGPWGAAAGSAIGTKLGGGSNTDALKGAALSYAGSSIGAGSSGSVAESSADAGLEGITQESANAAYDAAGTGGSVAESMASTTPSFGDALANSASNAFSPASLLKGVGLNAAGQLLFNGKVDFGQMAKGTLIGAAAQTVGGTVGAEVPDQPLLGRISGAVTGVGLSQATKTNRGASATAAVTGGAPTPSNSMPQFSDLPSFSTALPQFHSLYARGTYDPQARG